MRPSARSSSRRGRPQTLDADAVILHVKGSLAAYKAPRNVVVVETIGRSPAGKVDYKTLKALAAERLGK